MMERSAPDLLLGRLLPPQRPRPQIEYIPSQFAVPFVHEGRGYVYHTLTRACACAGLPASARAGEGHDALIEGYFLVPRGKDECAFYESVSALMRAYGRREGVRGFTILPTLACNARCVYCYEAGMAPAAMSEEVADATIRFIRDHRGEGTVRLCWFGGEPLLRPDIIDRITEGLGAAGVEYRSTMITNGSLITPEILARMMGPWRLRRIQVSMDGAEAEYVRRKRYAVEQDQYHTVLHNIDRLAEAGVQVTVRCNVDEDNLDGVPAFLRDLGEAVQHRERVRLYLAPLNHVRTGEACGRVWAGIMALRPRITEDGFDVTDLAGTGRRFRVNHCMADGDGVVITPDGSLYPCEHCPAGTRYGDVFHGVTDEEGQRAFRTAGPTREKCRACAFLPECTAFSHCPVQDAHCQQVRRMALMERLRAMLDRAGGEDADMEDPIC